jgi:2-oxoglutarate dehydrogenase E1 component
MDKFSSVGNQEQETIDDLYQSYLQNPESLDKSWQHFFAGFEFARTTYPVPGVKANAR